MSITESTTRLRDLAVSDSGFVFDPYTGSTFTVNPTGLVILRGLIEGESRERVVAALSERFTVEGEDLLRDLDEFLHLLRHSGIVLRDFTW